MGEGRKMTNVYNVWICIEKIDERNNDNGEDIVTEKVAKFKSQKKAIEFAMQLAKDTDTPRDKNHFTI